MHHPRHERNPNSKFSKLTQTVLFNFTVNGANLEILVTVNGANCENIVISS